MAEQLALRPYTPRAESAWHWARAQYAGRLVVRVIDLRTEKQAFVVIEREVGLLVDGSTHFLGAPTWSLSIGEEERLIAEYDAAWAAGGGQ